MTWPDLTQVLSRKRPFDGLNYGQLVNTVALQNQRPSLDLLPESTTPSVRELITRCWDKERANRPTAFECWTVCSDIYLSCTYTYSHTYTTKSHIAPSHLLFLPCHHSPPPLLLPPLSCTDLYLIITLPQPPFPRFLTLSIHTPTPTPTQIFQHEFEMLDSREWDIFFSHRWASKPFLSNLYKLLVNEGYRVWYDQNEMGFDLVKSMKEGIERSTVVLCCVDSIYQQRDNCMLEARHARQVLDIVDSPERWAISYHIISTDIIHAMPSSLIHVTTHLFIHATTHLFTNARIHHFIYASAHLFIHARVFTHFLLTCSCLYTY